MGICDSNNPYSNKNSVIQHVQPIGISDSHGYKFDCAEKNIFSGKKLNLKFIFYNFKIKYCVSHKPSKDSTYIIEIRIGEKIFPLIINKAQTPSIPNPEDIQQGYFLQKDFTVKELEDTYFLINVYEFFEDVPDFSNNALGLPEEYKKKCNYNSFFRISLLSFLFRSVKCDFAMMGKNQLSKTTRISFYCFIEHRERVTIKARALNNPYITKMIFKSREYELDCTTKQADNCYTIITPPITMLELQKADIFLETNESYDNYNYITLNGMKAEIIKELGDKILTEENELNDLNYHGPIDIHASYTNSGVYNSMNSYTNYDNGFSINNLRNLGISNVFQISSNQAYLYMENLPVIGQITNLYFTEYKDIYNTAILNLVNNDEEIQNFRKSKKISSDDFHSKLYGYYAEISKPNYNMEVLNEMHILLMRSIDNDKFMFLYPTVDSLNQMIILFLSVGVILSKKLLVAEDENYIIILSKLINILMRREELDNYVIYYCINRFKDTPNNPEKFYNNLMINLITVYQHLLSCRISENNDTPLIELFSRLYFQKKYFRKVILSTLNKDEYVFNKDLNLNDIYLYDAINDDRLNNYLSSDTKGAFNRFCKSKEYLNNVKYDNYRVIKRVIAFINELNGNNYPLDFTLFDDNLNLLTIMERDIEEQKYDRPDKIKLSNDFYESLMLLSNSYISISRMNKALIQATNGHNPSAVYVLFIYFKSLFDYYYTFCGWRLIMNYSTLELASHMLTENDESLSIPRLFWFYYSCGHMMLSGNLKWFIVNIINKKFDKFAYHWSFTVRQVFFKLVLFIINDRLKKEEGRVFRDEKLNPFLNRNLNNKNMNDPYVKESYKDFDLMKKEYDEWNKRISVNNDNKQYPVFYLPAINNGGID